LEKIIHINNTDLFAINKLDQYGNSEENNHIINTNFQYKLFSTIFMSGADFIQLDKSLLNNEIRENPFWKDKFIELLTPKYFDLINSVGSKHLFHYNRDENGMPPHPQNLVLSSYLNNLYYSSKTGIPSILSRFKDEEDRAWLKSAVTDEFYINFQNLHKLFQTQNLDTIAPKYSVLKKEIRIFEDLTTSPLYRNYQDLHNELKFTKEISIIAKDIKVFALKLYYKYLGNFDIKKSTFGCLREDNSINSFGMDLLEYLLSEKQINFYRFEDADFLTLINRRLDAIAEHKNRQNPSH